MMPLAGKTRMTGFRTFAGDEGFPTSREADHDDADAGVLCRDSQAIHGLETLLNHLDGCGMCGKCGMCGVVWSEV